MNFSEVYIGLQQKTIDAQENPCEVIVSNRLYEQQDYVIETNHLPHLISLIVSEKFYQQFDEKDQKNEAGKRRRARSNPEESIKENRRCIYGRKITKSRKATEWQSFSLYISLPYCHSTPNALYYQQSKKEQTKQITRREILAMKITDDIIYVGVNDHDIDLFEGQYIVPNGMAYNSYVIKDEKTAVMDTVDANFAEEWLGNIDTALGGAAPDYLIVQHMEPDHSANIAKFTEKYPEAKVVANAKAFQMMSNFFRGMNLGDKKVEVKNQETLSLGKHELTFVFAPMVHWPEVMVTYDSTDKVLFSADAFGKFGALDVEEDWDCEARRYYFGIVGKYGKQAENLLKVAEGLDIQTICALHGPILKENLEHYIGQYKTWSSYGVETEGVMIAYTSVYGNTKKAAETLASALEAKGCPKVVLCDLAREDMAEAVEDAFRHGKLVLATTTYNGDIFPFMRTFIEALTERGYQNRTMGIIENGSWAITAGKIIRGLFEKSKDLTWVDTTVSIMSSMSEENEAQIEAMAEELCK